MLQKLSNLSETKFLRIHRHITNVVTNNSRQHRECRLSYCKTYVSYEIKAFSSLRSVCVTYKLRDHTRRDQRVQVVIYIYNKLLKRK